MSGLGWRYVAKINEVSPDGRMLEGLQFDPDRRYVVIGRAGHPSGGVKLRMRGNDVQAKLPRRWSGDYSLGVRPGTSEWRTSDGHKVLVFINPEASHIGPGRHAWAPQR